MTPFPRAAGIEGEISDDPFSACGKKVRVRADTLGYLQHCFPGFVSEVDQQEARMVGRMAVRYAVVEDIDGSVSLRRTGNGRDYASECFVTSLASVARGTKSMPREFINHDGNDITPAFKEYAGPLVGEFPHIGRFA